MADKDLKALQELIAPSAPVVVEEPKPSEADMLLVKEACEAYGIGGQFIFNARVERSQGEPFAIVVTKGGAKVRFSRSMDKKEIKPLDPVRVDGISRKKAKK